MSFASWPASLPDGPLVDGYAEQAPNLLLRQEVDQGAARVRRKCAARPWQLTVTFRLTRTQVEALETFAYETLQGGALPFTHSRPRTGESVDMRIVPQSDKLYGLSPVGGGMYFEASVVLEVMP